jgi:hypothetical protein
LPAALPPVAALPPAAGLPAALPTCVPVPGVTRPPWIPEWLWIICPSAGPSPTPSGGPAQPGPTSGPGYPTATPQPGRTTQPQPGQSVSTGPGQSADPSASGLTPAPAMANPGRITSRKFGRNVPEVAADRLLATGFTFKGTVDMPTVGGDPIKALVFHADNLKADNYRIGTTDPGPRLDLGIDLDIDDVDIYATYLGGLITVPYLNVPLLPITLTADLIPTWLPLQIKLPLFSGDNVKAGQVFIRAGTVRGDDLSAAVKAARAQGNG